MIDDVDNMFTNSKGKDIFSQKGFTALENFPYYYSGLFYTGVGISAIWLLSILNFSRKNYK